MNAKLEERWIINSKRQMGASGSRVITLGPGKDAMITTFLHDDDYTCYCMTSGRFISEGEICYLPRSKKAMNKLTDVQPDHLDMVNSYLALGECVLSINEIPDIIRTPHQLLGKMDVALIKVYEDVEQHLDFILRDERKKETKVSVEAPDKSVKVKHYKYGKFINGWVTDGSRVGSEWVRNFIRTQATHGIFQIMPSEFQDERPAGDCGALVSMVCKPIDDDDDSETRVYGMLIACESSSDIGYYYIGLQMDKVIERVQVEMEIQGKGLQFYSLVDVKD